MSSAGQQLVAGHIPGEWINGSQVTTNSGGTQGTEEVVQSVTASLVTGRIYRIVWNLGFSVSATGSTDHFFGRIREDSGIAGTQLQGKRLSATTTAIGYPAPLVAEFTAVSGGNKTFSGTFVRTGGSGTITLRAGATSPSFMDVYYLRG